jgi:dipeptidyl aminopeptidase/acylaminoacyl peptidase
MIIEKKLSHGGSDDLIAWPASGGAPINLTGVVGSRAERAALVADSKYVYFTRRRAAPRTVPRRRARRRRVEQITEGERRLGNITFDKAMTRIAYSVGTYESPSDVWTANIDGTGEKRLTDLFADIRAEIGITKTERITWKSNDGTEIEGWLTQPYGFSRSGGRIRSWSSITAARTQPVGYGFNFKQQYFAANGYFVLDTNFRSSTGYGDAFKWATWGAWGTKDGQDVVSGIDYVIARNPIDRARGRDDGAFLRRVHDQLADHAVSRSLCRGASGAGISNWFSDYGTADIYRTKEMEFFGAPWQEEGIKRMILQSPLMQAGTCARRRCSSTARWISACRTKKASRCTSRCAARACRRR